MKQRCAPALNVKVSPPASFTHTSVNSRPLAAATTAVGTATSCLLTRPVSSLGEARSAYRPWV